MSLAHVRVGLVATALLALSACGSDSASSPKPLTAAQLAAHYDSLALALASGPTQSDSALSPDVALFNGVIADGILPSSIQVTVGGAQQTWFGNFANWVDSTSAGDDSLQVLLLWSNTQVSAFVGMILEDTHDVHDVGVIARGGDFLSDSITTDTGSFSVASGACSFATISDTATFIFGFQTYGPTGYTCSPATAVVSGTIVAHQGDTTASAALQSITFATQTITGVRLQVNNLSASQHVMAGLRNQLAAAHGRVLFFRRQ
jgi:hypothetical protein